MLIGTRFVLAIATLLAVESAQADDWRQFRGNDSSGVSLEQDLPTDVAAPEAVQWKVPLPGRGLSGPTVVGDRIFLTASQGYRDDQLHVLCFDASSGKQLWDRSFQATGRTVCHETMCMATPQPCSDGERIYAYFSCNDVICLDLDGNLIWYRGLGLDYPNASNSLGMSSSPVVVDGTLVLQLDTDAESFAIGLDSLTGETRWRQSRARSAIHASPTLFQTATSPAPQVILQSKDDLVSLNPRTGGEYWKVAQSCASIPSTTVAGDMLLAPLKGLTALRITGTREVPETIWSEGRLSPSAPTPVVYGDRVYAVKSSVLTCADLHTGKVSWQLRLDAKGGWSSPVVGDGHLYTLDDQGVLNVVQLDGEKGKVVSRVELGEAVLCTPAIANGAVFVRSDQHLWKFAAAN